MKLEPVLTVGLRLPRQTHDQFQSLMSELRRLVETAGGTVVKEFSQSKDKPSPGTLLGEGKLSELAAEVKLTKIKTVVFDDDLTASQQKNIEKLVPAKIVDRTRLILDIFAQRARTREGKLQVELAQLNYLVPRLTGSWRGYSQQMGGIGTRGPGERKIEVERRYVRDRIKKLKADIEDIREHRGRIRENRESVPLPQVALVGYTNVGKSTLLNTLVGVPDTVYADDKLFATLDPTTRRIKLAGGRSVLFTDTVGFIQKLPHSLVAAFHATLEEVRHASILIHLIDLTAENNEQQSQTVLDVIKSLNAGHVPLIQVFNKADALTVAQKNTVKRHGGIAISGRTGEGLPALLARVEEKLEESLIDVSFELPYTKRHLLSDVYRTGHILSEEPTESGTKFKIRIDSDNWGKIQHQLKK